MKKKIMETGLLLLALMITLSVFAYAQENNSNATLKQYLADLKYNPNDNALREKIIILVRQLKSPPAIPEDARRHMSRGMAAFEEAKSDEDVKEAIAEFEQVVNAVPWLGQGYRNLGIAQDKAGQYDKAISNLNLYLLTNPADADKTKDLIYKIEFRRDKEKKEKTVKHEERSIMQKLAGTWITTKTRRTDSFGAGSGQWYEDPSGTEQYQVSVTGNTIEIRFTKDLAWERDPNSARFYNCTPLRVLRGSIQGTSISGTGLDDFRTCYGNGQMFTNNRMQGTIEGNGTILHLFFERTSDTGNQNINGSFIARGWRQFSFEEILEKQQY
ncbi:MAG TPA: hypothetical protein VMU29_13975 [Smithella sp.]|nr:hypothetical protein [Smithella sp.]